MAERRLVGYRLHEGNASLDVDDILDGVRRIEEIHDTRVDRGRIHRWLAESCLRTGDRRRALRYWSVAAANGQAAAVLTDLRDVLRRRIASGHRGRDLDEVHRSEWAAEALPWLDVLARSDRRGPP
jgi:hypothetical protein